MSVSCEKSFTLICTDAPALSSYTELFPLPPPFDPGSTMQVGVLTWFGPVQDFWYWEEQTPPGVGAWVPHVPIIGTTLEYRYIGDHGYVSLPPWLPPTWANWRARGLKGAVYTGYSNVLLTWTAVYP